MWTEGIHLQELAGSTLGLIGVGSIGRRVAQMASAMGMRVIAVREHIEKGTPEGVAAVFPPSELDQLLHQSDFVVLAAPLIEATRTLDQCLPPRRHEAVRIPDQRWPRPAGRRSRIGSTLSAPTASPAPRSTCSNASRCLPIRRCGPSKIC